MGGGNTAKKNCAVHSMRKEKGEVEKRERESGWSGKSRDLLYCLLNLGPLICYKYFLGTLWPGLTEDSEVLRKN